MTAAFDAARTALGAAALLAHLQQDQELVVMVDASADHVGRRSPATTAVGGGGLAAARFFL